MKKHLRYLVYLARHKAFVFLAGLRTGAPLWRLFIHDGSKFLPCEWAPYTRYFYGQRPFKERSRCSLCGCQRIDHGDRYGACTLIGCLDPLLDVRRERKLGAAFDRSWLHHQHANPHHWQHWILREDSGAKKVLAMPEHFVREMVADWMGAGRAINGSWDVRPWYLRSAANIRLHPESRQQAEQLIEQLCGPLSECKSKPQSVGAAQ